MTQKLKEQLSKQEEAKLKNLNEALAAVANAEEDELPDEIPATEETTTEVEGTQIEEPTADEEAANLEDRVTALEEGQAKILEVVERISEKVLGAEEVAAGEEAPVEEPVNDVAENAAEESEQSSAVETETEEVSTDEESVENSVEGEVESPEASEVEEETVKGEAEMVEAKPSVEETPEINSDAEEKEANKKEKEENEMTEAEINALVARIKNEILDEKVEAPEVEEVKTEKESNSVSSNWRVRYNQQVEAAWDAYRLKSVNGQKKLQEINAYNYQEQVKAGNNIGDGPMTMTSLGGFILPPEVDKMIHGRRTDYSPLLDAIEISETTSLQFAYATRSGDIEMRPVKLCQTGGTITDDTTHTRPDNLKPIETYDLVQGLAQLEEMAAVTPICTSVTRFAAADILSDVAAGYRTSYDRGLAQLFIIRVQQAIDDTDNVVEFNPESDTEALIDFVKATTKVADGVVNGKFMFNAKTKAAILEYLFNSGNGGDLTTNAFVNGDFPTIFGYQYIVVPNDLMPTLGEGDTREFIAQTLDGTSIETVTITSPVFYGDFTEYRGKIYRGGLSYDVSAEASYEVYGATGVTEVRSAWQRNELVIRGAYYRGGYIADKTVFAGMIPVSS